MHHWLGHCHPSHSPWTPFPWHPYGWFGSISPGAAVSYVPIMYVPVPVPCGEFEHGMKVPHELSATKAAPDQEALIGGTSDVHLAVEYVVAAGVTTAKVTLTVTEGAATTTWSDTGIAEGYHVKEHVMTVEPGANVKLSVTDCTARLRWCETVCCR